MQGAHTDLFIIRAKKAMIDKNLNSKDLAALTGYKVSTIYRFFCKTDKSRNSSRNSSDYVKNRVARALEIEM